MKIEMPPNRVHESEDREEDIQTMLRNLGLKAEDLKGDILDIGCGDGELVEYLREKIGARAIGIDLHPQQNGKDFIIKGDAQDLPFAAQSFDMTISHASVPNTFLSIYDFDNPEASSVDMKSDILKSMHEAIRILRPGGSARFSPVPMGELYPSEKARSEGIREALESIKDVADVELVKIGVDENPDNGEKRDIYRITITKK